jgi:hypothetical protein
VSDAPHGRSAEAALAAAQPPAGPQPYRESPAATLRRTIAIGLVLTTILSVGLHLTRPASGSLLRLWLTTFPAILWFPLGGHFVELVYLNFLRIRWAWWHRHKRPARMIVWFLGGLPLGAGLWWTWTSLGNSLPLTPPWWWGMPFFVVVEFVVHAIRHALGYPNFWDGRE